MKRIDAGRRIPATSAISAAVLWLLATSTPVTAADAGPPLDAALFAKSGSAACERAVSAQTGATIRVIPFDSPDEPAACIADGRPSPRRALFARAY